MTTESDTKFARWCWDLDKRLKDWCNQTPEDKKDAIIRDNVWKYDLAFSFLIKRCAAPGCNFPLKDEGNFQIMNVGEICYLCWCLYAAVKGRLWFVEAQRESDLKRKPKGSGAWPT
jgi:hypothetical protein